MNEQLEKARKICAAHEDAVGWQSDAHGIPTHIVFKKPTRAVPIEDFCVPATHKDDSH